MHLQALAEDVAPERAQLSAGQVALIAREQLIELDEEGLGVDGPSLVALPQVGGLDGRLHVRGFSRKRRGDRPIGAAAIEVDDDAAQVADEESRRARLSRA